MPRLVSIVAVYVSPESITIAGVVCSWANPCAIDGGVVQHGPDWARALDERESPRTSIDNNTPSHYQRQSQSTGREHRHVAELLLQNVSRSRTDQIVH